MKMILALLLALASTATAAVVPIYWDTSDDSIASGPPALIDIASLTPTDGAVIIGDGTNFVVDTTPQVAELLTPSVQTTILPGLILQNLAGAEVARFGLNGTTRTMLAGDLVVNGSISGATISGASNTITNLNGSAITSGIDPTAIDSGAATDGQVLTADGAGNSAYESLPAATTTTAGVVETATIPEVYSFGQMTPDARNLIVALLGGFRSETVFTSAMWNDVSHTGSGGATYNTNNMVITSGETASSNASCVRRAIVIDGEDLSRVTSGDSYYWGFGVAIKQTASTANGEMYVAQGLQSITETRPMFGFKSVGSALYGVYRITNNGSETTVDLSHTLGTSTIDKLQATYDGSTVRWYINGVEASAVSVSISYAALAWPFMIGVENNADAAAQSVTLYELNLLSYKP